MFFIESTSIAVTHLYPKYKGLWKKNWLLETTTMKAWRIISIAKWNSKSKSGQIKCTRHKKWIKIINLYAPKTQAK